VSDREVVQGSSRIYRKVPVNHGDGGEGVAYRECTDEFVLRERIEELERKWRREPYNGQELRRALGLRGA
jgi:hypothetical protein